MTKDYHWTKRGAKSALDVIFGLIPRPRITKEEWNSCALVAHRGCVDQDRFIYENTLAAFETARDAGAWGVELDVQWTLDAWPVVIHDPDTAKLPGAAAVEISKTELDELQTLCPLVPRLEEVLERFCGELHLMIEIKSFPPDSRALDRFNNCLARWQPVDDYHLLSLQPEDLRRLQGFPTEAKLLVAITNTRQIFEQFKSGDFGGMTGHFLLLNDRMRDYLKERNIPWGTGFVNSINLLAREIRSGTRWIFSDAVDELLLHCESMDER